MGDEQDGGVGFLPDAVELEVHAVSSDFIERAEGLVHEQDGRSEDERPSQGDPLLHTAGELIGMMTLEPVQADHLEQTLDFLVAVGPGHTADLHDFQREGDVLPDGSPVEQGGRLEDEAVVAVESSLPRCLAVDQDRAAAGLDQVGGESKQGGFTAAGGPDQRDELSLLDVEVDGFDGQG